MIIPSGTNLSEFVGVLEWFVVSRLDGETLKPNLLEFCVGQRHSRGMKTLVPTGITIEPLARLFAFANTHHNIGVP